MTTIDRWNQSADAFSSRVDAIAESQWMGSTPCSEWTVQELVDHVAGTHVFFGSFLGLPELVEACHSWLQALPPEVIRAPGRYGDPRPVGSDADAQTKMLAFAGRNP
jgi:hypothetical protein